MKTSMLAFGLVALAFSACFVAATPSIFIDKESCGKSLPELGFRRVARQRDNKVLS